MSLRNGSGEREILSPMTSAAAPANPPDHPRRVGSERRDAMLADLAVTPLRPEERKAAALVVCANTLERGGTATEARELLDALGLLADPAVRT